MGGSSVLARMKAGGIADPTTAAAEARRAGLPLHYACALLQKESGGGANVFGHDPTIFNGAGTVTREKYAAYLRERKASGNRQMQGVGPCQLTWWETQDAADRLGGCWRPEINMRVGFSHLAALMKQHGAADGARRYNGSGPAAVAYSRDLLAKAADWQRRLGGATVAGPADAAAAPRALRRGDEGAAVRRLTRRLSYVRDRDTGEPYLDGARDDFDEETEAALKAFQHDRKLEADGLFGTRSARRLAKAVEHEKARRARRAKRGAAEPEPARPAGGVAGGNRDVSARALRAAALSERADEALIAAAERAEAGAAKARRRRQGDPTARILRRIDRKLSALVELEQAEALGVAPPPAAAAAAATAAEPAAKTLDAGTISETPLPPSVGGDGPDATPSREELARALAEHAAAAREARESLAELVRKAAPAALGESEPAAHGPNGATSAPGRPRRPAARRDRAKRPAPRPAAPGRAPSKAAKDGGAVVDLKLGDQSRNVRASKIAMARYLKAKGSAEHVKLRRALALEARNRKAGGTATKTWQQGVKAVQHLERRPVTGVLDGELQGILHRRWPGDSSVRRIVRATPAWKAVPGQLTPNFNLRELGCSDGTPYVEGLVREQQLTPKQAKERARQLAIRLERVRKADGGRPLRLNCAFRTKAHNASLPGAVPNSAHVRGFAADVSPPPGVTLARHHQNMRAAFEAGVGLYTGSNFVHGDFDPALGRRDWTG